jgi:hypothetical protein
MKSIKFLAGLWFALAASFAMAQPVISTQNLNATGACTANSCVLVDMRTSGSASAQLTGTYTASGGLSLQRSNNSTNWETVSANAFIPVGGTGTATITSGSVGTWQIGGCVGFRFCRIVALGAVTGTATVEVFQANASVGGTTSISGGAGDASAANQVTGNNSLASIDTKTPALGQALAAGSTPVVLPALQNAVNTQGSTTSGQSGALVQGAVTTAAPSYTNAQTSPLSLDTAGNLRVNVVTGGAGGGNVTGGTAHDAAATSVNPVLEGGYASAAAPTDVSADGDAVRAWRLRNGAAAVQQTFGGVLATTGNGAAGTGVQRVTLASDSTGQVTLAAGSATIGALTANQSVNVNQVAGSAVTAGAGAVAAGTLRVTQASDSPLVAATGATGDSACGTDNGTCSLAALIKRNNQNLTTLNTSVNADPNYTQAPGSAAPSRALAMGARSGANLVAVSQANATAAINVSTATTTQLVALSSGQVIHVTAASVIAGGTGNLTFVYGTGTNCGTGTTSLTGAYPLIANAGLSIGSGLGPVLVVPAGNALCVTTSAAVQMSGHVAYTQFTP